MDFLDIFMSSFGVILTFIDTKILSGKWPFMANNSHLNIKDYVSDINRKREGSNTLFNNITARIFKIATGWLPDQY